MLKLCPQLPNCSAKLHRGRPGGSRVWTQHFWVVRVWGQAGTGAFILQSASALLNQGTALNLELDTAERQHADLMNQYIEAEQCGRIERSKGTLEGGNLIVTEQMKLFLMSEPLIFQCHIYMCWHTETCIFHIIPICSQKNTHTHTLTHKTHTHACSPEGLH